MNLAENIEVVYTGADSWSLKIDGQEFPWHITEQGVIHVVSADGPPAITITIPAHRVTTNHDWLATT